MICRYTPRKELESATQLLNRFELVGIRDMHRSQATAKYSQHHRYIARWNSGAMAERAMRARTWWAQKSDAVAFASILTGITGTAQE